MRPKPQTPCVEWQGFRDREGYGRDQSKSTCTSVLAHRRAYELEHGPIPEGHELDHLCENKGCVNVAHLEAITRAEHARRHPLAQKTHCKHGHPFDEANTIRRKGGGRDCRECGRRQQRRYQARKRAKEMA